MSSHPREEPAAAPPPSPLRLIAFDLDSTLIMQEGIDEFARAHGVFDDVARLTEEAMRGNLPFSESFRKRLSLLQGLSAEKVNAVLHRIEITEGAREVVAELKQRNYKTAIFSGGFHLIGDRVAAVLGIDRVVANHLEIVDGFVTGRALDPIIDGDAKARALQAFAASERIPLERTVAVGDGANDLPMMRTAGISVSFNGKPKVEAEAKYPIRGRSLAPLLDLLP